VISWGIGNGRASARPTNQCTQIVTARFYNGYTPAKKWVIVATIACPQSRDFKRWAENVL
jgi:hypothetical protein